MIFAFNSQFISVAALSIPLAPTSLTYSGITSSSVNLSWTPVSGAIGYKVIRYTSSNPSYSLVTITSSTTFKDTNLTPNTKYFYFVRAYNSVGSSNYSPTISFYTAKAATAPSAPTSLTYSSVTTNSVNLSWSPVTGAIGYKVIRYTSTNPTYTLVTTTTSTSFIDTNLIQDTKYLYFVRAYNSNGSSNYSPTISISTTKKIVLGYATYYYSGDSSSYNSMVANTSTIDEIATDTFATDGTGNINGLIPTNQITYANTNGIKTFLMITNNFNKDIAKKLLESSTNRKTLINNILGALKTYGYKGVNIDLENIYYYDRSYLTTFMSELYSSLKPLGYYVTIAVPAKTNGSATDDWGGAFDYSAISRYSDQILIMTYDEHYFGGTPGPIASIGWVENVINYALTVIPKEKILLGTAAYGYDWSSKGSNSYGAAEIYNLAQKYNTSIKWDSVSQSPYFTYKDSTGVIHTVWFENSYSVSFKLDLVNKYDLAGIGIWRLGQEDPAYWTSIKTKLVR
ncbi:glycosyl hydrolase family 18 protein [Clostridium sp. 'White wine YQ']|uniref:glycosyl hydrolase family 18 protein n=1 Tax=Clostridium sp. 'White wine YQ' TaxID=3027474 RepID=UPI0023656C0A|nr:glycosyl hydrolase family 18 protein [Clostridium sp. 'White wine YQ']MDD7793387.1 glycosyl hydrolase family 18 protein [Clostridium sp. 'White wine YQ']